MSNRSRDKILGRLHGAAKQVSSPAAAASDLPFEKLGRDEKIDKLKGYMEAVRTEVHVVEAQNWIDPLKGILLKREIKTLLYAPQTTIGEALQKHWPGEDENDGLPQLVTYLGQIENFIRMPPSPQQWAQLPKPARLFSGRIKMSHAQCLWSRRFILPCWMRIKYLTHLVRRCRRKIGRKKCRRMPF